MARNPNRKRIVLCGSSRFKEEHLQALGRLTLEGYIVIPMGMYGHVDGLDMEGQIKKDLDDLHLDKIDAAHAIYVVNANRHWCPKCREWKDRGHHDSYPPPGRKVCSNVGCYATLESHPYVGDSTRREIEYAEAKMKQVIWLQPHYEPDMPLYEVVTTERRSYRLVYEVRAADGDSAAELVTGPNSPKPKSEELLCCDPEVVMRVEEVTSAARAEGTAKSGC